MTIASVYAPLSYTSTGTATYPYDWPIQAASWLQVYVDEVLQGSGYSVTDVGDAGGGNVVFDTAPTAGSIVLIKLAAPLTQLTDYTELAKFPAQSHEDALDKLTQVTQQQQEQWERSLSFTAASPTRNVTLAEPVTGGYLRYTSPTQVATTTVTPDSGIGLPLAVSEGGTGLDMSAMTGLLKVSAGTISAFSTAGIPHQYGSVVYPTQDYLTPQMFGAVADYDGSSGTDNTTAFRAFLAAVGAGVAGITGVIPPGRYAFDNPIWISGHERAIFAYGAHLYYRGTGATDYAIMVLDQAGNPQRYTIAGLNLHGNASCAGGFNLHVTSSANAFGPIRLRDCFVDGFTLGAAGHALYTKYCIYLTLDSCQFGQQSGGNTYGWYCDVETNSAVAINCAAVHNLSLIHI